MKNKMTVAELIEKLSKYNADDIVTIEGGECAEGGYAYLDIEGSKDDYLMEYED